MLTTKNINKYFCYKQMLFFFCSLGKKLSLRHIFFFIKLVFVFFLSFFIFNFRILLILGKLFVEISFDGKSKNTHTKKKMFLYNTAIKFMFKQRKKMCNKFVSFFKKEQIIFRCFLFSFFLILFVRVFS